MKIEGSNQESNMNNDSTSETKNFSSTIYDQYQKYISIYEKFSLNEQVTTVRESINKVLEKIPKDVIPTPDEKLKDYVQRPVYEFSETANTQYPYISSLCRTHGVMIVGASTVAAMILLRGKILSIICIARILLNYLKL